MLERSKVWSSICNIIKSEKNQLTDLVLGGIHYVLLHKYSISLLNIDTNSRKLISKTNGQTMIEISKIDKPFINYDNVTENEDGFFYIQKIVPYMGTNQYLQIKVHKTFIHRFCF